METLNFYFLMFRARLKAFTDEVGDALKGDKNKRRSKTKSASKLPKAIETDPNKGRLPEDSGGDSNVLSSKKEGRDSKDITKTDNSSKDSKRVSRANVGSKGKGEKRKSNEQNLHMGEVKVPGIAQIEAFKEHAIKNEGKFGKREGDDEVASETKFLMQPNGAKKRASGSNVSRDEESENHQDRSKGKNSPRVRTLQKEGVQDRQAREKAYNILHPTETESVLTEDEL